MCGDCLRTRRERLWGIVLKDIRIANNIKTVEKLKCELLRSVSDLFSEINTDADCATDLRIADSAADLINITYVLCRRLGVEFDTVTECMKAKLEAAVKEQNEIERNFGDMSELHERLSGI